MITAAQIRAARAMTGLSLQQLADAARLSSAEVEAIETGTEPANSHAVSAIRAALEASGIQFLADGSQDGGGAGLRLKHTHGDEGTRPENLNSTNDD
ncbi:MULTISPECIES: helix-turn-helix domain-containing protein [Rhizobium]|uniref:Helix-turn-helix transcriptional regulator n=1 Tax=Rhizobium rhododendri TaxID=2506430 RepID=A0ABY8IJB0_9HYPH|nr:MULTISPECIES: helix-turn-helix transcriptional regulator [Rhizobium]MBO9098048.1 helix-turn-helix domain-containing protein [Rhizobium sp. L58/93]MBO9133169.1 helix-turn-helix domain-containing protein [Rhizobium sp. B209b/85]MBO9168199.1 helix-turn-helix domain-containing protein [Rhizobium sp. L245/93]MBO9184244.1 helix-turn-helix domain-containing protein [Rhizobium sp. E27B/91]MBZ5760065.1 helix-turn-helix domain-containing protein [Rhizobium sp. VS19-DR96]